MTMAESRQKVRRRSDYEPVYRTPVAQSAAAHHNGVSSVLAGPADVLPEPVPVWLAALIAARCAASVEGGIRAVEWNHIRGRAIHTNSGVETEFIQPLGVRLAGGDTVAVSWIPGETGYTVEVIRQQGFRA
jgi:hypothetical protein